MELQIIKHNDILFRDLLRAISIKTIAWPHPFESQVKWIVDNMQPEDMHVFLTVEGKSVAYLTLSHIVGKINEKTELFLGIGCVCSAVRGKGYGNLLMQEVNSLLVKNNYKGLLFCREGVKRFYQNNRWKELPADIIHIKPDHSGIISMVYNCPEVNSFEYSDREF